jgi:hypothetical protein
MLHGFPLPPLRIFREGAKKKGLGKDFSSSLSEPTAESGHGRAAPSALSSASGW